MTLSACQVEAGATDLTETLKSSSISLSNGQAYQGEPIFFRIIKRSDDLKGFGRLEAHVEDETGLFQFYKAWDICTYSGDLGPKLKEGDGQSPEGFYFVKRSSLNPHSSYHLSFNLGFPNAYDRAHGRTGSFLMVHGDCASIGCYAMTDDSIEEIYTLLEQALDGGQGFVRVHIFPFEMTDENLSNYTDHQYFEFWQNLKDGWDWFELNKRPPNVQIVEKTYSFNHD
ncbi:MAG: murein L,D-transpeptidase family protein [Maricaulaceae bacterium]